MYKKQNIALRYNVCPPSPTSKLKSHDGKFDAIIGGPHESFEFFTSVAGGVQNLLHSFQVGLQEFRNGEMPRILGNPDPVTFEEIESVKDSDLKFENVENLSESLGEDGMSVSMDLDKVETLVLADTDGASKKISNSVSFCGGNVQESPDLGARTPIGVIRIENFEFGNPELIRKSLKLDKGKMG